ncbi:hypothetical protein PAXRUDRAFT_310125 [Paxillus rubicundulus Ve08.2h10]|uniref:Uncharacterized protein n=1 Tax=Paxillus rubicundulus Ve08.2h10 TaxID=930991 RepID=A0A0D0E001_9AGAM|nr:hypothetical protein PAXRUDRAFT_310125 [Paxillus rubicundulus Ve08.2h10]
MSVNKQMNNKLVVEHSKEANGQLLYKQCKPMHHLCTPTQEDIDVFEPHQRGSGETMQKALDLDTTHFNQIPRHLEPLNSPWHITR